MVSRTKRGRPRASEDRTQVTSQGPATGIHDPWSAGTFAPLSPSKLDTSSPWAGYRRAARERTLLSARDGGGGFVMVKDENEIELVRTVAAPV